MPGFSVGDIVAAKRGMAVCRGKKTDIQYPIFYGKRHRMSGFIWAHSPNKGESAAEIGPVAARQAVWENMCASVDLGLFHARKTEDSFRHEPMETALKA